MNKIDYFDHHDPENYDPEKGYAQAEYNADYENLSNKDKLKEDKKHSLRIVEKQKSFRGYKYWVTIHNLEEFKHLGISRQAMIKYGARGYVENPNDDTTVIRKILSSIKKNFYLVRYIDTGDQYTDYWKIYTKR